MGLFRFVNRACSSVGAKCQLRHNDCVYVPQSIEEASMSSFGFLFCLDHHFVDGAGAKILADSFLKSLGNEFHRAPSTALSSSDWKDSIKNLAPPWIQMMNEDQHVSGPSFDEAVRCDSQILVDARVGNRHFL